jgi:hypothetical protein
VRALHGCRASCAIMLAADSPNRLVLASRPLNAVAIRRLLQPTLLPAAMSPAPGRC